MHSTGVYNWITRFCFSAASAVLAHVLVASTCHWESTEIPQNSRRSAKIELKMFSVVNLRASLVEVKATWWQKRKQSPRWGTPYRGPAAPGWGAAAPSAPALPGPRHRRGVSFTHPGLRAPVPAGTRVCPARSTPLLGKGPQTPGRRSSWI